VTTIGELYAQLERYVSGTLEDGSQADAFEELLFSDAGAEAASDFALLVAGVRHNNGRGLRHPFCGDKIAAKIRALDLDVVQLDMGDEGGDIAPLAAPRPCDIVVTRYGVDLQGVNDLEIEITLGDHPTKTITGVAFDDDDKGIYACCEYQFVAVATQMTIDGGGTVMRFISVDGGERRVLKEFRVSVATDGA